MNQTEQEYQARLVRGLGLIVLKVLAKHVSVFDDEEETEICGLGLIACESHSLGREHSLSGALTLWY